MKKLFIGLLIIAAGAATYFYLQNKKTSEANALQKELVIGKWKMESVQAVTDSSNDLLTGIMATVDSNLLKYNYEFTKEGNILRSLGDSITKDTSRYAWDKKDQIIWKDDAADTIGTTLQIFKLNKDSLQVQSSDSTIVLFTKLK
ncbi:MAG: phosphoribosylaminoimidazolesuccinocarboxamide synthase [Chitinophagaceae bacterium]